MPAKPPSFRAAGTPSKREQRQAYDAKRATASPWRKWYALAIWRHPVHGLRAQQLRRQPLCETCLAETPLRFTPATVVHHKQDHKGVWELFIDPNNHASACQPCHDSELQRQGRLRSGQFLPGRPRDGVGGSKSSERPPR